MKSKMKLTIFLLALVAGLGFLVQQASATHQVTVFGPKTFTRTTGTPDVFQESFSLPTLLGTFTLRVESAKVSSASIKLNGTELFGPKDFNQNVSLFTKELTPRLGENTFDIRIASQPGSSLRLTLTFLSPVSVSVTPDEADVTVQQSQQFNATVSGTSGQQVTWSIIGNGNGNFGPGVISAAGLYTASNLAPEPPFVTIQARSVANPFEADTAMIIVRDLQIFNQSNAEGNFDATNYGKYVAFGWSGLPEGTAKIVIYRSKSKDGPWEQVLVDEFPIDMTPIGRIVYDETDLVPADTANDYFYRMEALSATGQLLKSYSPVFVPKFVEQPAPSQQSSLRYKTPPTQVASLLTFLAAASLPSGCESPGDPFVTVEEFLNSGSMSLDKIRQFLQEKNSWLAGDPNTGLISDIDPNQTPIDFAKLVFEAASSQGIDPQLLLTLVEREQGFLLRKSRPPDESKLALITGCGQPNTIAKQIQCAATSLRNRFNELASGGDTINNPPWNLSKTTETRDGVNVKPANAATGALFAYNPVAGPKWGGNTKRFGGNFYFCDLWHSILKFAKPQPLEPLVLSPQNPTLACGTPDPSVTFTASGGRPGPNGYTWSVSNPNARVTVAGVNKENMELRPPENTGSGVDGIAYDRHWQGKGKAFNNETCVDAVNSACCDSYKCDDSVNDPNGCLQHGWPGPWWTCIFIASDANRVNCIGLPQCFENTGLFATCKSRIDVSTGGVIHDVRTQAMKDAGCKPCRLEMQGVMVTVTDAAGATAGTTVTAQ